MNVIGEPERRGNFLYFKCDDGKERTTIELGQLCGLSYQGFYQRWNRMKVAGKIDNERLFHKGKLPTVAGCFDNKGNAEWQALSGRGKLVEDINVPEPTKYDNKYTPAREVKDPTITGRDVIADMERRHLETKGVHLPKCRFSFGDLTR